MLMMAVLFAVLWQWSTKLAQFDTDRSLKQLAYTLANLQDPSFAAPRLLAAMLEAANAPEEEDQIRFELRHADGTWIAGSAASPHSVSSGWRTVEFRHPDTGRMVRVAMRESIVTQMWNRDLMGLISRISLVVLLLIVPILLISSALLARFGLAPVNEFSRSLAARSPDNLTPIATAKRYPELGPVFDELNRLLERLRGAQAVERRFFADAAHELLTPIAALRTQVHLLATAPDESAKSSAYSDVESGLQRVSSMIRQLLTIARVSAADTRLDLKLQDLLPLVQERLGAAASRALDKKIELDLEAPRDCPCEFDSGAMASVLDNVIDNAIRYVQPEGRIRIELRRQRAAVAIAIADDGPGIAQEYREKVFERFFRVPGNTETGSGLGLAIVARIVGLHKGTVALLDGIGSRGLMVSIQLPVRSAT
jgi:two-component system OmpR family sensor kinase/two-component system sensor histidine kinase QseC